MAISKRRHRHRGQPASIAAGRGLFDPRVCHSRGAGGPHRAPLGCAATRGPVDGNLDAASFPEGRSRFLGCGAGYGVFSLPFVVVNPDLR